MPTIRVLVRAFDNPTAGPHVFAGVESTFPLLARMYSIADPETPSKRTRRTTVTSLLPSSNLSDTHVLSLIATILFYVLSRMMDQEITPEQFLEWRDKAVSTLLKSRTKTEATEDDLLAEIDRLMPLAQEEGWLGMEWFLNIMPDDEGDEMEGVEMTNGRLVATKGRGRSLKDSFGSEYIGLGTMMQDATDYLGERQRQDYKRWKTSIMAKIEKIEASKHLRVA
jgi:origin recognition complex subunit 6